MQDVTSVLYECLGRATHIQNELERQSSKSREQASTESKSETTSLNDGKIAVPTVDEMMANLERISTLSEIG